MTMKRATFSNLIAPGLRKVFFDTLKALPTEYDKFFNGETSKQAYEEDYQMAGVGTMPEKLEGASIQYEDFLPGETKRYTHLTYGKGIRVTKEMQEDDLYGPMKKMVAQLAKSARYCKEVGAWSILNNAFDTTYYGFDTTQSLCDTAHPRLDTTLSNAANRPTSDCDLSFTALENGILYFENLTDERGFPRLLVPKWLIIGPLYKFMAREILGSGQKPYTAANEINPLQAEDLQALVTHYFTDTDQWFLAAAKGNHDFNVITRVPLDTEAGDDFDTYDGKFKARQRFSVGFGEWYGIYGSTGV